ncbi:MAG TPA: hypothetical protein VEL76_03825, partial [Gemmataceae bacterium]|nr:hypothetical protein [Gemmataceae bacterium]
MTHLRWLALFLTGAVLLQDASTGHAQRRGASRSAQQEFVEFPFDNDLGQILSLLNKLPPEFAKRFKLTEQAPGQLSLDNLQLRELFREAIENPEKTNWNADEVETARRLQEAAKAADNLKQGGGDHKADPPGELPKLPPAPVIEGKQDPQFLPIEDDPGLQDRLLRWAEELLEGVEHSRLGKLLQNLENSVFDRLGSKLSFPAGLEKLGARLKLPQGWDFSFPEVNWLKAPNLSLPSPPRLNLNFSLPDLSLGSPNLGGGLPSLGGSGGAQTIGTAALWGGLVVLLALIVWRLGGGSTWLTRRAGTSGWALGPWPVNPASVTTRAELVQAFEYLALLLLGLEARAWNHRDIAERLSPKEADAPQRAAAEELAGLYEQARYAPDDEPLAPPHLS